MSPSIWDGTLQWDPAATKVINTGVTTTFNSCLPNCSSFIVNWTNPIDGQIFTNLNPVSLSANATVTTGSVKQVEFFVGNTSVGIDSTTPYTLNWTPPTYGSYALKAVATNNLANTTTATLNINVQMPPSCGTLTGLTSSGITASSATVAWPALSGAKNYTVDYKLGTATTWTNLTAATTALSANLTALTAGTLYNWRVKANCTGATGAYVTAQFTTTSTPNLVPAFDHIVVVIGENTSASSVFGSSNAPYINALAAGGAKFTNSYALSHPSQPNYIQFYSGNNQGITNDNTITTKFTTANLGKELINAGKTYTTFSEGLPSVGYDGSSSGLYARKHNPAANWMGNGTNQIPTTTNQPFTAFPTNFSNLPSVSFVVPNLCSDGHDVCSPVNNSVLQYDKWVQTNLNAYKNWAVANNSLLIVTYDEDDFTTTNKIATVFYGAHVLQGVYAQTINHYNVLRTIEDAFRLTTHAGSAATSTQIGYCWTSLAGIKNQSNSQAYGQISSLLGTANIYPNPVTSLLQVDMTDLNTATSIKVIDVNGKVVLIHPINEYDTQVDVSQLTKGFYILFINEVSGKQLSTSKFIKE